MSDRNAILVGAAAIAVSIFMTLISDSPFPGAIVTPLLWVGWFWKIKVLCQ
jgi:hypothetical protein